MASLSPTGREGNMQIVIEDHKPKVNVSATPKNKVIKSKSTRKRSRSNMSLGRYDNATKQEASNPDFDHSELMKLSIN